MPDMDAILGELSAREPIFHRWEWGVSRDELLAMTDDAFWEIEASGQAYSQEFVEFPRGVEDFVNAPACRS